MPRRRYFAGKKVHAVTNKELAEQKLREGFMSFTLGDNKTAILKFNESIQLAPTNPKAYYWRGLAYQQIGQYERAQADFEKAKSLGHKG